MSDEAYIALCVVLGFANFTLMFLNGMLGNFGIASINLCIGMTVFTCAYLKYKAII